MLLILAVIALCAGIFLSRKRVAALMQFTAGDLMTPNVPSLVQAIFLTVIFNVWLHFGDDVYFILADWVGQLMELLTGAEVILAEAIHFAWLGFLGRGLVPYGTAIPPSIFNSLFMLTVGAWGRGLWLNLGKVAKFSSTRLFEGPIEGSELHSSKRSRFQAAIYYTGGGVRRFIGTGGFVRKGAAFVTCAHNFVEDLSIYDSDLALVVDGVSYPLVGYKLVHAPNADLSVIVGGNLRNAASTLSLKSCRAAPRLGFKMNVTVDGFNSRGQAVTASGTLAGGSLHRTSTVHGTSGAFVRSSVGNTFHGIHQGRAHHGEGAHNVMIPAAVVDAVCDAVLGAKESPIYSRYEQYEAKWMDDGSIMVRKERFRAQDDEALHDDGSDADDDFGDWIIDEDDTREEHEGWGDQLDRLHEGPLEDCEAGPGDADFHPAPVKVGTKPPTGARRATSPGAKKTTATAKPTQKSQASSATKPAAGKDGAVHAGQQQAKASRRQQKKSPKPSVPMATQTRQ